MNTQNEPNAAPYTQATPTQMPSTIGPAISSALAAGVLIVALYWLTMPTEVGLKQTSGPGWISLESETNSKTPRVIAAVCATAWLGWSIFLIVRRHMRQRAPIHIPVFDATSNEGTPKTSTAPTEHPSSSGPVAGLVIGLLALAASLYWMYGSGTETHGTSKTYREPGAIGETFSVSTSINPLPSVIATTVSFVWTAAFGLMLARTRKRIAEIEKLEPPMPTHDAMKTGAPVAARKVKCVNCGSEDALVRGRSLVTGEPLPNLCPACGHTWEGNTLTTKP